MPDMASIRLAFDTTAPRCAITPAVLQLMDKDWDTHAHIACGANKRFGVPDRHQTAADRHHGWESLGFSEAAFHK